MDYVKKYTKWLSEKITQVDHNGIIEITTPFLDRKNDYTQIYIKTITDNEVLLTDGGYIVDELEMSGVKLNTSKRRNVLNEVIRRLGIKFNESTNELFLTSSIENLPRAKHKLIQAMLSVDDMFYLSSRNVVSVFLSDVESFLNEKQINYSRDVYFMGKSGNMHSYGFLLQKNNKHPERILQPINHPEKGTMERTIFSWVDVKDTRPKHSNMIVLLNDSKRKVSSNVIEGFQNYGITPIPWSQKDQNVAMLA